MKVSNTTSPVTQVALVAVNSASIKGVLPPGRLSGSFADAGKVKLAAGWLIEQAGWKGRSIGAAAVHDTQALVLVNKGGATGHDIQRLSETIRKDIAEKFDIELEPEVNFINTTDCTDLTDLS